MARTGGTALKLLLKQYGVSIEDGNDLDKVSKQLNEESVNIKARLDSLVSRYGLLQNMLGAVEAYKLQQGEEPVARIVEGSDTIVPE